MCSSQEKEILELKRQIQSALKALPYAERDYNEEARRIYQMQERLSEISNERV